MVGRVDENHHPSSMEWWGQSKVCNGIEIIVSMTMPLL